MDGKKVMSMSDKYWTTYLLLTVCSQMRSGVAAIFGPTSPALSDYVNSACNTFHVPHIQLHPYRLTSGDEDFTERLDFTLRLSPPYGVLSTALTDYIQDLKWNSFTVIYERTEGLLIYCKEPHIL